MSKFFYYFKRIMAILAVIVVAFLLQTSVFNHLELASVVPNLLVLLTAFAGFMNGRMEGMFVGFTAGFIADLYFSEWFGMFALIYLVIGFLNGSFRTAFFGDDIKLPLLYVAVSDLVYGIIIYLCLYMPREQYEFVYYFFNVMMPEAVYTRLITIIFYLPLIRLNQWIHKTEPRSTRSFG